MGMTTTITMAMRMVSEGRFCMESSRKNSSFRAMKEMFFSMEISTYCRGYSSRWLLSRYSMALYQAFQ